MKKMLVVLLSLCLALTCFSAQAMAAVYQAGTYVAAAEGNNGPVEVSVTFTEDKIASIEVTVHSETPGISDAALMQLPAMIVDAQSLAVDTISGATNSSNAVLVAVKDCVEQAGGDVSALESADAAVAYSKAMTAGTYTAVRHGHHSDVVVEVTVSQDAIESVKILEEGETYNLADGAFTTIPERIVACQTTNVDSITGATYSSKAVCAAVADCIEQAGGEEAVKAFSAKAPAEEFSTETHEIECDVVVAGAGLTGVSAALAAQDAGAKVYLVEKLSFHGGISQTCAGYSIMAAENDESGEQLADYLLHRSVGMMQGDTYMNGSTINEAQIRTYAQKTVESVRWLEGHGIEFNFYPGTKGRTYDFEGYSVIYPTFKVGEMEAPDVTGAAIDHLVEEFVANGGVIIYNTAAEHVLTDENGNVAGLTAAGRNGAYTFHAPAVVLATGGYANSQEMIAKYASAYTGEANCTLVGNVGDALKMGEELNADIYEGMFLMAGSGHSIYSDYDMMHPYDDSVTPVTAIFVNPMGLRVNSETPETYSPGVTYVDPDGTDYFWAIINQEQAEAAGYLPLLEEYLAAGHEAFFKADTIETLATQLKMSSRTLTYTLNRYNDFCEAGVDEDLSKSADSLKAMYDGPWYATKQTVVYFGSVGGLVTDENTCVLREGQIIPGLYAAGEASNGGIFNLCYSGAYSISVAHTMGQLAGENAAAFVQTK